MLLADAKLMRFTGATALALMLSACGGNSSSTDYSAASTSEYTLNARVTGLLPGTQLVLADEASDTSVTVLENGELTLSANLPADTDYNVVVQQLTQPQQLSEYAATIQRCTVVNGEGRTTGNIATLPELTVNCSYQLFYTVDDSGVLKVKSSSENEGRPASGRFDYIDSLVPFNHGLVFFAEGLDSTEGLWLYDLATEEVQEIKLDDTSFHRVNFIGDDFPARLADKVFFTAKAGPSAPTKLYVTDGTQAGTSILSESYGKRSSSSASAIINNKLYFTGDGDNSPSVIWETDGTPQGTMQRESASLSQHPDNFIVFDNKLYFSDRINGVGEKMMWVYDPAQENPEPVKYDNDQYVQTNLDSKKVAIAGSKLYVAPTLSGPMAQDELMMIEAGSATATLVKKIDAIGAYGGLDSLIGINNILFFWVNNSESNSSEPWISDGTEAGTKKLKDLREGSTISRNAYSEPIVWNGTLYFFVRIDSDHVLMMSDGTADGTVALHSAEDTGQNGYSSSRFITTLNHLFFSEALLKKEHQLSKNNVVKENAFEVFDAFLDTNEGVYIKGSDSRYDINVWYIPDDGMDKLVIDTFDRPR